MSILFEIISNFDYRNFHILFQNSNFRISNFIISSFKIQNFKFKFQKFKFQNLKFHKFGILKFGILKLLKFEFPNSIKNENSRFYFKNLEQKQKNIKF